MDIFRAQLETRNFDFEAYGPTHDTAWGYLVQALNRHGNTYDLKEGWYNDMIEDIVVRKLHMGGAYRDREEF